jgi:hypothetical protein
MDDARSISTPVDQDLGPFAPINRRGLAVLTWAVFLLFTGIFVWQYLSSDIGLLWTAFIITIGATAFAWTVRDYAAHCAYLTGYSSYKGRIRNSVALLTAGALYFWEIAPYGVLALLLLWGHGLWRQVAVFVISLIAFLVFRALQRKFTGWLRRRTKARLENRLHELSAIDKKEALLASCTFVERALLRERQAGREPDAGAWEALSSVRAYATGEDNFEARHAAYDKTYELFANARDKQNEEKSPASRSVDWVLGAVYYLDKASLQSEPDSVEKSLKSAVVSVNKGLIQQVLAKDKTCRDCWPIVAEMTEVRWQIARCKEALMTIDVR